jgi:general secretion pathway protein C
MRVRQRLVVAVSSLAVLVAVGGAACRGRHPAVADGVDPCGLGAGTIVPGLRPAGEDRYEIEAGALDAALQRLGQLAGEARLAVEEVNGTYGFKVTAMQPSSGYCAIGLRNGDVLLRVNDLELNSPRSSDLVVELRRTARITIDLTRNGHALRKEIRVVGR